MSVGLVPAQTAVPAAAYAAAPAVAYAPIAPHTYAASPYGGFWMRLLAHLIDHAILSAIASPLAIIFIMPAMLRMIHEAQRNQQPSPEVFGAMIGSFFVYIVLAFVGQWLYDALMTSSSWQGTVGKRVLRLKVTDEAGNRITFGRATGRFFGKILSGLILYIGFLMIAFNDRKRGLHDNLAGTLVLRY